MAKPDAFHPAPPAPSAPSEHRFLEHLTRHPEDRAMRMVYADWLEETGDPRRSQILRMFDDPNRVFSRAMRKATRKVPNEWLAQVSPVSVERCDVQWKLKCPKTWTSLKTTAEPAVRHCGTCEKEVYFCSTLEEVTQRGRARQCVAFSPALAREEADNSYDASGVMERVHEEMWLGEIDVPRRPGK